jgi:hypothetical protein
MKPFDTLADASVRAWLVGRAGSSENAGFCYQLDIPITFQNFFAPRLQIEVTLMKAFTNRPKKNEEKNGKKKKNPS